MKHPVAEVAGEFMKKFKKSYFKLHNLKFWSQILSIDFIARMYVGNQVERRVDAIEQELFIAYGRVAKTNPPPQASLAKTASACSLTPYISPYTVSEEEKRIKTNIFGIVSRPIDLSTTRMLTISAGIIAWLLICFSPLIIVFLITCSRTRI